MAIAKQSREEKRREESSISRRMSEEQRRQLQQQLWNIANTVKKRSKFASFVKKEHQN
ncbi:MAG: hypothetical protein WC246_03765 [Candidatus Paceibacterota bacterium]|jgi:uncharacterized tellurite resistance protein B-like protein